MNLASLSIRRPIFMTCVILLSLIAGLMAISRLGVDLFPDVTLPVVAVTIPYPGAGPSEVETLVARPLEDELSTLSGLKRLSSSNQEGVAVLVAEFTMETDVKYAEQQIRDRIGAAKSKLPTDIKEPIVRRLDPADQPILTLSLKADLPPADLYDLANEQIKPRLQQVAQVGLVDIVGGRRREIAVQLDRDKLKDRAISASFVANRLAGTGEDIPVGKNDTAAKETVYRTVGQFKSLDDIKNLVLSFFGNDVPVRVSDVGTVTDTLEEESSRAFINGKQALELNAFRQSGANTINVSDDLKAAVAKINVDMTQAKGHPQIVVVRDGADPIRLNVEDVKESIYIGIALAVIVVFCFLANARSTIITGLALPNSLIGAFILMALAGFTINLMTLLALSLSIGLLIDDAIVVRENIFRHLELGEKPVEAALHGTAEVRLAVIATTLTVIAVFGPLGFLTGVVGQFFKQFGFTICFAMAISLFDALTVAPMLSAYFAGVSHGSENRKSLYGRTIGAVLRLFNRGQDWLENVYEALLKRVLRHPLLSLLASVIVALLCTSLIRSVPQTFLPDQDNGEFAVSIDLPPGTDLDAMTKVALDVDNQIRSNKEVKVSSLTVGSSQGDVNSANYYIQLVDRKQRSVNTTGLKERLRDQLKKFAFANPQVKDFNPIAGGQRPFQLNIMGANQEELERIANAALVRLKKNPALTDVDVNFRPGKPEFQVVPDKSRALLLGTSTAMIGGELRTQIEGVVPAKFRQNGIEYDVRVRLREDQRNLEQNFNSTYVPNLNQSLVHLREVAKPLSTVGPSKISRVDRNRFVQIGADIAPGAGMGNAMEDIRQMFKSDVKLPPGVTYAFVGEAESFNELSSSIQFAMGAGVLFIFLVLASLYESFFTPFTIMLALPLAMCGSVVALAICHESLNIFSMIGVVMLLGVATKNSILLVDYAHQLTARGLDRSSAIIQAGRTRLRPILMTTMALVAGTVPIAIGLNEASKQRTAMGVAIIGGLVSSTLLTLIVVPAAYSYVDRFNAWVSRGFRHLFMSDEAIKEIESLPTADAAPENPKESVRPGSAAQPGGQSSYVPAPGFNPVLSRNEIPRPTS